MLPWTSTQSPSTSVSPTGLALGNTRKLLIRSWKMAVWQYMIWSGKTFAKVLQTIIWKIEHIANTLVTLRKKLVKQTTESVGILLATYGSCYRKELISEKNYWICKQKWSKRVRFGRSNCFSTPLLKIEMTIPWQKPMKPIWPLSKGQIKGTAVTFIIKNSGCF